MTICIAALCTIDVDRHDIFRCSPGQEVIIGISDRLVSTGDTSVEVSQPKYSKIIGSIVVSSAGRIAAHEEVFENTKSYIWKDFNSDPRTIPVLKVAKLYSRNLINYMKGRKDKIAQYWVGTGYKDYKKRRSEFDAEDWVGLDREIRELGETEAIVTGIDEEGAHIYQIEKDGSINFDEIHGLSIIGSGSKLAYDEISQMAHTRKSLFKETLIRMYMAKKRAELGPFVGKDTDIFIISNDHSINILSEDSVKLLDKLYSEICAKQKEAIKEAGTKMASFLNEGNEMLLI